MLFDAINHRTALRRGKRAAKELHNARVGIIAANASRSSSRHRRRQMRPLHNVPSPLIEGPQIDATCSPKYSSNTLAMCPAPHAGSKHVSFFRFLLSPITCSSRARVAHGGVGKSSRLSLASDRWAITA
jgi:hypothetical protein